MQRDRRGTAIRQQRVGKTCLHAARRSAAASGRGTAATRGRRRRQFVNPLHCNPLFADQQPTCQIDLIGEPRAARADQGSHHLANALVRIATSRASSKVLTGTGRPSFQIRHPSSARSRTLNSPTTGTSGPRMAAAPPSRHRDFEGFVSSLRDMPPIQNSGALFQRRSFRCAVKLSLEALNKCLN